MTRPRPITVATRCRHCNEPIDTEIERDSGLCGDCARALVRRRMKFEAKASGFTATGTAGTYLASIDRQYLAEKIREARRVRE